MSQIYVPASAQSGVVDSVTGTTPILVNGVSGVAQTGNITISTSLTQGIVTINLDSGSITGETVTIAAGNSGNNSGSSVRFSGSGSGALLNLTGSNNSTMIGKSCGDIAATGINNTAIGFTCANLLTTGSNNIAHGVQSLNVTTGSNNIALGYQAGSNYVSSESSNICIGNLGTAAESNIIRIGTQGSGAGQQNECFIAGIENQTLSGSPIVVTSAGQLGVGTSASFFTPNSIITLKEDFVVVAAAVSNLVGDLGWTLSTPSSWTQALGIASAAHPGSIGIASFASAASRAINLSTTSAIGNCFILGGGILTINWVFNIQTLSNSTNRYILAIGLGDTVSATQANGVWFGYSDNLNSGEWTFNAASASTPTNMNSTVAVTTGWHNAQIIVNAAASSIQFIMDSVSLGTITTNIPATGIVPNLVIQATAGTVANSSIVIDLMYLQQVLTTAR